MRLLLVEDDIELAQGIANDLRREGFAVDTSHDGSEAEFLAFDGVYDAIILDLGLPGKPGIDVLKTWREKKLDIPVLILTARDTWTDRVQGLKSGADDYLGKPFHFEELSARINALIRRSTGRSQPELSVAGFMLDEDRQQISFPDGQTRPLTGTEFKLLRYLMMNPDKLLSKQRLTDHVYEWDHDRDTNVLEVYVRRLREKIGREYIETQRGQGYLFRSNP
ncbi:MAG: response regulator transcription factor [Gammaproteobacteria bacterium]|nr:response regulator transcription factor [Gammaproteobacteria bacterium]